MESLFERPVVIGFAVLGGLFSLVAMLLKHRRRDVSARHVDIAGYVFMGVSVVLFIIAGFRSQT
jgi:predicted membrane channel-forming protein YqfA (hemolysin III family)